jgi:hypothetical protein
MGELLIIQNQKNGIKNRTSDNSIPGAGIERI